MPSKGVTSAGSCLAFTATAPATETLVGYTAITSASWTPATEIVSMGEITGTSEVVTTQLVCSSETVKRIGTTDYGTQSIEILFDSTNAAQVLLANAFRSKTPLYCREKLSTAANDAFFYKAFVSKYAVVVGAPNDMIKLSLDLVIDGSVFQGTAT